MTLCLAGSVAGQTQLDLNQKAGQTYADADRALNLAYAKLLTEASPAGRTRLRQAERDWLRFRSSDCDARTGSRDGSIFPMLLAQCLAAMTRARTAQLNAEFRCQEADLSCGGHAQD